VTEDTELYLGKADNSIQRLWPRWTLPTAAVPTIAGDALLGVVASPYTPTPLAWLNIPGQKLVHRQRRLAVVEVLGCVDLLFEPKESTDEIEKTQEVSCQLIKTRKEMSVRL
jgi:hypothetical protein